MSWFPIEADKYGVRKNPSYRANSKLDKSLKNRQTTISKAEQKRRKDKEIQTVKNYYAEAIDLTYQYLRGKQVNAGTIQQVKNLLTQENILNKFEADIFVKTREFLSVLESIKNDTPLSL